jgi:predicted nucleic acid-binding protein
MVLIDSSVWIDYFNGKETPATNQLDSLLGIEPISIGDLILTEVLQGFRKDSEYETAKDLLTALKIYKILGIKMAILAADNYRTLRKKGVTVRKTADTLIATFCIERNIPLLFSDKDFNPFVKHLGLCPAIG